MPAVCENENLNEFFVMVKMLKQCVNLELHDMWQICNLSLTWPRIFTKSSSILLRDPLASNSPSIVTEIKRLMLKKMKHHQAVLHVVYW